MKALVHRGPGRRVWEDVPDPELIDPTDAIVRITAVTIRGTAVFSRAGETGALKVVLTR